jgi:hypothetical protein
VATTEWKNLYPASGSTPTSVPQAWTDALNNAIKSGLIPVDTVPIPVHTDGWPTYRKLIRPRLKQRKATSKFRSVADLFALASLFSPLLSPLTYLLSTLSSASTKEDPLGKVICSNPWGCVMPDDIIDAPDGMVG